MLNLGENLKREMKTKGITIKELSKISGVSIGTISEISTGKEDNPKLKTVINISNALNVPLNELIGI